MTFPEALTTSRPNDPLAHHRPIRRASWVHGLRIQWLPQHSRWAFGNQFTPDLAAPDPRGDRHLDLTAMQGCLTPDTMLESDWEVAE